MAYGDLSTFLPRAEGEALDVERAKSESAARAQYLSSMDQFYAGLEESKRQFDIQQALSEREFTWRSGFEEKKLTQETEISKERLELEKYLGELQGEYWKSQSEIAKEELGFKREELGLKRELYSSQLDMQKSKFAMEADVLGRELFPKTMTFGRPYNYDLNKRKRETWLRNYGVNKRKPYWPVHTTQ